MPVHDWVGLWSVARYDLGLTWEEFADLTPSMFAALCTRRNIRMRHERFANALTASAIYNVHRAGADVPMVTAYDFVRDAKQSEAHEQTQILKRQILEAVTRMPSNTPRERFMTIRGNIIAELVKLGRTDATELWAECWPSLIPEGE
jgi:hypothetical protein